MAFRTDLALELQEQQAKTALPGLSMQEEKMGELLISRIHVTTKEAAQALGKPQGEYVTLTVPPFSADVMSAHEEIEAIAQEIRSLVGDDEGLVLVAGLGNQQITPDALGPKVVAGIIATRHIRGEVARAAGLSHLRPVAAIAPGVLGQTGMETGEIIASLVKETKPVCVLAVDALASRSLERLGCTIQVANTGIAPGSGVANARRELSMKTLGVPVVSLGVPTVVDGTTLASDLLENMQNSNEEEVRRMFAPHGENMMVTPREIDVLIDRAAKVIALALNCALQPQLKLEDIIYLSS